jgi:hypothetical protein
LISLEIMQSFYYPTTILHCNRTCQRLQVKLHVHSNVHFHHAIFVMHFHYAIPIVHFHHESFVMHFHYAISIVHFH